MMRYGLCLCIILTALCGACAKPSQQASLPSEQTSTASERAGSNDIKEDHMTGTAHTQDYKLVVDQESSFLNAPMSNFRHPALAVYENEKVIEINKKEDLKSVDDEYWAVAKDNIDPETNLVKSLKLPVHLIFNVTSKDGLRDILSWFKEMRDIVSTLEIRFAKDAGIDTMDTRIDLRTRPEDHNRVILTSIGDEPVDIRPLHIIVSGDVVQISNMMCNNCYALSTKLEVSVGKLFEAKKISLNGTRYVKKNQEFLIKPQMLIDSYAQDGDGADVIFENCYFSDHELHDIVRVHGNGLAHASLRNVGFYKNISLDFYLTVGKSIKLDHVVSAEGKVNIKLSGMKPEVEQKDCDLPEGAIVQ